MATEAQKAAGRKGAAVREAKKQAKETGMPVLLEDYQLVAQPDGTTQTVDELPTSFEETEPEAPPIETVPGAIAAAGGIPMNIGGLPDQPQDRPEPEGIPVTKAEEPDIIETAAAEHSGGKSPKMKAVMALVGTGEYTEDEAMRMVLGTPDTEAAPFPGIEHHEDERERLAKAYKERMKNYVPPVLQEEFTVELKVKFADYIRRAAAVESIRRGEEVSPERMVSIIVGKYWQNDQDRQIIEQRGAGTGPRAAFNPVTGAFGNA